MSVSGYLDKPRRGEAEARAARNAAMVEYYRAGASMEKAAHRFGLCLRTVHDVLHRLCPQDVRGTGRPRT